MTTLRTAAPVGLALAVAGGAAAQSRQIPGAPQTQPIVISGATVHPVSGGAIERGYVTFEGGVIIAIGEGDPPQALDGARIVDARGLHVYPGLVAAATTVGLSEVGSVDETQDFQEFGDFKPEVRAGVAVNPDSDLIPVTRANGILTAMLVPSGGIVSGRASTIRLDGWTWEQMAIDPDAGLVMTWPRTETVSAPWMRAGRGPQREQFGERLDEIERFFDQAEHYVRSRASDPDQPTDLRYEALRPVLSGDAPVIVRAASAGQIESAVAWAVRRGFRIVILGGDRADEALPILRKYDVPVIIEGTHRLPRRRHDDFDQPYALPSKLHAAGVRFCIASGQEPAHERNLNHVAATAAAYGLPVDAALRAVTLDAATIVGLGDHLGSLEVGKQATLIVTTGHPLEITTDTVLAFIDGREIDLGSRHTMLYEKYVRKYDEADAAGGRPAAAEAGGSE